MSGTTSSSGLFEQQVLFTAGVGGYHSYRIPALLTMKSGAVLALAEGRKRSLHDAGQIDLVQRISADGGRNWSEPQVIMTRPEMTCGNPCPVLDRSTGRVWLWFCQNRSDGKQSLVMARKAQRTSWLTYSDDEGASWSPAEEMTGKIQDPAWTWYATGPGHGIQLESGRLLAPANYGEFRNGNMTDPYFAHVIYSDDHGQSWRVGGPLDHPSNEGELVERSDGSVYFNARYEGRDDQRRVTAISPDGGEHFQPSVMDETLIEPTCQASVLRWTRAGQGGRDRVLFCNPASREKRENLTVRLSYDECATWPVSRQITAGFAAYSDLALAGDGSMLCLYEGEGEQPYHTLTLVRFDLAWVEQA